MKTNLSGYYRWIAADESLPPENIRILLCRLCTDESVRVEEGSYDGGGDWRSAADGIVDDVAYWSALPEPPDPELLRRTMEILRRKKTQYRFRRKNWR